MRKSTLFISTVLTIFMMAIIFGVASAYQQIIKNQEVAQLPATQVVAQVVNAESLPVQNTVISPEQATMIASTFLNDTAVYSVETVDYEGVVAYLVTFSSGDLVYVSTSGEILAITKLPPVVVVNNSAGGNSGNTSAGSGEYQENDDNEESESDDD